MFSKPQFTPQELADLNRAYQDAVYEVYYGGKIIPLSLDRSNSELDSILKKYHCTSWALVTAFNPYSQGLSTQENQQRHQNLIVLVQQFNLTFFNAVGKDRDGAWTPEPSIFIVGIELEKAIAIGQRFQQNAIVFGELGTESKLIWL